MVEEEIRLIKPSEEFEEAYVDFLAELEQAGVDAVYNLYEGAGSGFAAHVCETLRSGGRASQHG